MNTYNVYPYLLFASDGTDTLGGADDLIDAFQTLDDAISEADMRISDGGSWAHILDLNTSEIVYRARSKN